MKPERLTYLSHLFKEDRNNKSMMLTVFPELLPYLYDFTKPLRLIDLSYMECIYGDSYTWKKDNGMWGTLHYVDLVNGKAQFNWGGRRFETRLTFFQPNQNY